MRRSMATLQRSPVPHSGSVSRSRKIERSRRVTVKVMLKRVAVITLTAALVASGVATDAEACSIAPSIDHRCCAEPTPEPARSCCSDATESAEHQGEFGCDCVHPSRQSAATTAASTFLEPNQEVAATFENERGSSDETSTDRWRPTHQSLRTHPPPPTFLLGCSFLI